MQAIDSKRQIYKLGCIKMPPRINVKFSANTPTTVPTRVAALSVVLNLGLVINACNWVDSTGVQRGTISPVVQGTLPSNFDAAKLRVLPALEEQTTEILPSINQGNADTDWAWGSPYQTGALNACTDVEGFDLEMAAARLEQACSNADDCNIDFEFSRSEDNQVSYAVSLPALRAPIGLAYTLTATDADGVSDSEFFTLCAISINEAPVARDDRFDITASMENIVSSTDSVNLLSNDSDDTDVRNEPMKVLSSAIVEPELAEKFILFDNGGFSYQARADLIFPDFAPLIDTFTYAVSDGLHTSTATVTLRIRSASGASNYPPVIYAIDDEVIGVNDRFQIEVDASDADRDVLTFSNSEDTPEFVEIDPATGTMSGVSDTPGSYTITLIADDGTTTTRLSFMLFVQTAANRPPFADDIQNKTVSGNFAYDVSGFFGDADGDPITFSATGIPQNTRITANGVIQGTATRNNRGRHIIRVFVSDGRGGIASDGFRLTIN